MTKGNQISRTAKFSLTHKAFYFNFIRMGELTRVHFLFSLFLVSIYSISGVPAFLLTTMIVSQTQYFQKHSEFPERFLNSFRTPRMWLKGFRRLCFSKKT